MADLRPIIWKDEPCWISRTAARQIVHHALECYPHEMCGILAGPQRAGHVFFVVDNVHEESLQFFRMSPSQQIRVWQDTVAHGGVAAIVHSHTTRDAYPSDADIYYAAHRQLFYVILSIDPRQLRAFSIDHTRQDGYVWEHPVEVDLSKPGLWYCWVHMRYEDCTHAYMSCFECGHTFKTAEDLLDDRNSVMGQIDGTSLDKPEGVVTCPHCVHDF